MAFPLIPIMIVAAAAGVKKLYKASTDKKEAEKVETRAKNILTDAQNTFNISCKRSNQSLQKLGKTKANIFNSNINYFVNTYKKLIELELQNKWAIDEKLRLTLSNFNIQQLQSSVNMASTLVGGLATGSVGGAMTAFGAYGSVGLLAHASTGTAIASLHGIAASNATLSVLGGGTLAAGGLGVTGGAMVLGGLVAAPALAIMGCICGAKASKYKEDAYKNLAIAKKRREELMAAHDLCCDISEKCDMFITTLNKLNENLTHFIYKVDLAVQMHGLNYNCFTQEQKEDLMCATATIVNIKLICDTNIMNEDGSLEPLPSDVSHLLNSYTLDYDDVY